MCDDGAVASIADDVITKNRPWGGVATMCDGGAGVCLRQPVEAVEIADDDCFICISSFAFCNMYRLMISASVFVCISILHIAIISTTAAP